MPLNRFNQLVGPTVENDQPGQLPNFTILAGQYGQVEHINLARHLDDISRYYTDFSHLADWTYLFEEPYQTKAEVQSLLTNYEQATNPYHLAITNDAGQVVGTFALLNINPDWRTVEMGRVIYFPELRHSRLATEAQYLVMKYVFEELHYRRYEWKCDSLNQRSRKAASRLGFCYEGTFKNAVIYKGRSRDTAWFSITPEQWPILKRRFESWLNPANFDANGRQIKALREY